MKNETTAPSSPAKYKLEIIVSRDVAPHLAYRLAEMRIEFAYLIDSPADVKLVVNWSTETRDPLAAAAEIRGLHEFGALNRLRIFGPL